MNMDIKKDFRKNFIEGRIQLSPAEICKKSAEIFNRVYTLTEYASAAVVLAYMSFGNEVMTRSFIERCFRDGKRVALPRVMSFNGKGRSLAVFEIRSINEDLVPGFKGILEPDASVLEMLEPEAVDLAVVPGVAFDKHCNRMGYGAGYYDRFLPQLRSECLKAGVAFDIQLAEQLPTDEFDFKLDMVITESRIFGSNAGIHKE